MPFRIVCVIILASRFVFAQGQPQQPKKPFQMSDVECALAKFRLDKFENSLKEWRDWWATNKDAVSEYEKEKGYYITLAQRTKEEKRRETIVQYSSLGGGIAVVGFGLWGVVVAVKRFLRSHPWRPFTRTRSSLLRSCWRAFGFRRLDLLLRRIMSC